MYHSSHSYSAFIERGTLFPPIQQLPPATLTCNRQRTTVLSTTMKYFWQAEPLNKIPGLSKEAKDCKENKNTAAGTNDAVVISGQLKGAIQRMYVQHITEDGVDYKGMGSSGAFSEYVSAASRLPDLEVQTALQSDSEKIAFYVNLYNAATQHGIVARGPPPSSSIGRLQWGMRTVYLVGKYRLSLHEMENGILRKNRRISVIPPPFNIVDSRRKLCVDRVDPRIHFVLNCAANSCPPVLFLTVENLDETLKIATRGFLNNRNNFKVEDEVVSLSMIFKWYQDDFAPDGSDASLLKFIFENGDENDEHIVRLGSLMEKYMGEGASETVTVQWQMYDWRLNSA